MKMMAKKSLAGISSGIQFFNSCAYIDYYIAFFDSSCFFFIILIIVVFILGDRVQFSLLYVLQA